LLVSHFGVDPYYLGADQLVLPVALGFMTYGLYILVNNVLYARGATMAIGIIVLVAALANACLNVLLIPSMGPLGAAIATWMAYLVLVLLSVGWSRRLIEIKYPWWAYAYIVMLICGLYGLGQFTLEWAASWRLVARLGLIMTYIPLILVGRLYSIEEVKTGINATRKWLAARGANSR